MEKHLHIVTYAIPYPPDYGGIIDVYYRIRSLSQLGVKIHLHCYDYLGERSGELENLCYSVHYYQRKIGVLNQFSLLPYIVFTRKNKELLNNLKSFDAPILFDGLHSTYGIKSGALKKRKKIVRAHNIEHLYYWILGNKEKKIWKKLYFYLEAIKLKRYEKVVRYADKIACISADEEEYFSRKYGNSFLMPASHYFTQMATKEGYGDYILFHGNLMVSENNQIAEWILNNIATKITYPIYIAGKCPSEGLKDLCNRFPHVRLIADPDEITMNLLISDAHINLLPLFESCGLKLKLLYALYSGRHCIVNNTMTEGTMLESVCTIANTADEMISEINRLFKKPYGNQQSEIRKVKLEEYYNNTENAKKLIQFLYE